MNTIHDENKNMKKLTCVQCHQEMLYATDVNERIISACLNAECPNFGLLQLGVEIINQFLNKE